MGIFGSANRSNMSVCGAAFRCPSSVRMIASVERRSWTNKGSVGTSKESRSALPVQFRDGTCIRLSRASASCKPATVSRGLPSAPRSTRGSGNAWPGNGAASWIAASSQPAISREGFASQSSAGERLLS